MKKPILTLCESAELPEIKSRCPRCNYGPLCGATCVKIETRDEAIKNFADLLDPPLIEPEKGDVSICGRCGEFLVYDQRPGEELFVRTMNRKDNAKLKKDGRWPSVVRLRDAFLRNKKRGKP